LLLAPPTSTALAHTKSVWALLCFFNLFLRFADVSMTVHMAKFGALQEQRKKDRHATTKHKYKEKCKDADAKKQKKDDLALCLNCLATFTK
jgi:hypothetical protein